MSYIPFAVEVLMVEDSSVNDKSKGKYSNVLQKKNKKTLNEKLIKTCLWYSYIGIQIAKQTLLSVYWRWTFYCTKYSHHLTNIWLVQPI